MGKTWNHLTLKALKRIQASQHTIGTKLWLKGQRPGGTSLKGIRARAAGQKRLLDVVFEITP